MDNTNEIKSTNVPIGELQRQLTDELEVMQSLRRKYPYLGKETETVSTEISKTLNNLDTSYKNLNSYQGPEYNLINLSQDDIGVAEAKLKAQEQWIEESNVSKENSQSVEFNCNYSCDYADY